MYTRPVHKKTTTNKRCPYCGSIDLIVKRPSALRFGLCALAAMSFVGRNLAGEFAESRLVCGHCKKTLATSGRRFS